jgi:hypothetical protein
MQRDPVSQLSHVRRMDKFAMLFFDFKKIVDVMISSDSS